MKMIDLRKKVGLSQTRLAALLGMNQGRVSDIERNAAGRKETRQMQHHLVAIDLINELGEIKKLEELVRNI